MSSTSGGGLDLILSHVSEWNRCEHTQAPMSTSAETFLLYLEQWLQLDWFLLILFFVLFFYSTLLIISQPVLCKYP